MDVFAAFIAPALAGVFVGVMSGLLGVGGGTIMVPIFRLAFGMSPLASTATSLFAIIPTSISGVVAHARAKTCVPKLGLALGVGGAVMSPVGVWLASVSPGWLVICVAAVVIGFSAFKMFKKAVKCAPAPRAGRAGGSAQAACANAATAQPATPKPVPDQPVLSRKQYLQGACIGLVAGLASGYVGVGGGFIMVPLMLAILDIPMSLASGTSLIAIMILAIPGVIEQGLLGNIDYLAGIAIVVGSIPGALVGARLVRVVPERQLRFIFGGFLLVAAVMLMLNEFGILG
ncbi:MAG: sulfite exporter TauE/SafE family protein [Coriobacteriia bacterium]|nr:sulfite exporter TauE/SafE family protein [Coriobacteriia bacterium]